MNSFIHKRAHEIARYLEKKGEKLSCLKWEEAEFVPSIPWKPAEGRTLIYGETHILLAPNGCWFAFRQGRGYILVARRPAFRWNIPKPTFKSEQYPVRIYNKTRNPDYFLRDENKLEEMEDMVRSLVSIGHTYRGISKAMGMSQNFILKFMTRNDMPRRHAGAVKTSYDAMKKYYDSVIVIYRTIDSGTH